MKPIGHRFFHKGLITALAGLFVFPYLLIFTQVSQWSWPETEELSRVLWFTFAQASLSALFSLILGAVGAHGLMSVRNPRRQLVFDVLVLLPNIVPQLLVILAAIQGVTLVATFPFGMTGIVLIHTLLNAGLVAMALVRLYRVKIGGMAELAYVEGVSLIRFMTRVALPYLKSDIALLALFVFTICFTSFAVPLIVGGVSGTTLEVMIFEKIRMGHGWSEAIGLSFMQVTLIFMFSVFLRKQEASLKFRRLQESFLARPWALVACLGPSVFVMAGLLSGLPVGLTQLLKASPVLSKLPSLMLMSILIGIGVGLLSFALLALVALVFPSPKFQSALRGYAAPSSVLTGFAMLLWGGHSSGFVVFKLVLGITLIGFPTIYRWLGESSLTALKSQAWMAYSLGASPWQVFRSVVFPQVAYPFGLMSGVAAFWACGDFAYSSIVASADMTLALLIEDLMGAYRLEMATVLVWPLLFCGALSFAVLGGIGFVLSRKSHP